ncbi:MAG: hypothetical protein PHC52_08365, partial [Syntrophales bacterium]|nr:hypothetical protein [Syntrophales bacterium]
MFRVDGPNPAAIQIFANHHAGRTIGHLATGRFCGSDTLDHLGELLRVQAEGRIQAVVIQFQVLFDNASAIPHGRNRNGDPRTMITEPYPALYIPAQVQQR